MAMVYKYQIPVDDTFTLRLPTGARVLTAQMQGDTPCVWALVDPAAPQEERRFRLAGSGHEVSPTGLLYIGTFQMHRGALVFHLFEVVS